MKASLPRVAKRAAQQFAERILERVTPSGPLSILSSGLGVLAARLLEEATPFARTSVPLEPPFSSVTRENWLRALELWLAHGLPLLEALPTRACPACGTSKGRFLFNSYDGYPFHECAGCGTWFVPKHVDQSLFERLFGQCREAQTLAQTMAHDRRDAFRHQGDVERIGPQLDEALSLLRTAGSAVAGYLDVGCGVGHSLELAAQRGLVAVGLEVDPACIELARSRGLDVRTSIEPFSERRFSVVALWETLEHLAQPRPVLEQAYQLLDDQGLLVVTTPNLNSPVVRILRGDCSYVHGGTNTAGHVNLFHLASLSSLLESAGFTVLDVDAQYSNNPYEIASHLRGWSRGAHDMAFDNRNVVEVPRLLEVFLNATWPYAALIERIVLSAPILKVVACRKGAKEAFLEGVRAQRSKRRQDILSGLRLTWNPLPELTRWRASQGTATACPEGIEFRAVGSESEARLTSPQIRVVPFRRVLVCLPVRPQSGSVTVGVLDPKGVWLLQARTLDSDFTFESGANRSVRLVLAVRPRPAPAATEPSVFVERGRFVDLGPSVEW